MKTKLLNIKEDYDNVLSECSEALEKSGVIAFPTETVYGIGCNLFDLKAVSKIFDIKNRNKSNPLAAHIGKISDAEKLADNIPDDFYKLAEHFLPGPLSIILRKKPFISDVVTAGFNTIAIRFPNNIIALDIINNFGNPLAATSANISGNKSPVNAEQVAKELFGLLPIIVDGGTTKYRKESTVISLAYVEPILIRYGAIPVEEIQDILHKNLHVL